jgi:mediator of RNA polymerase II transcription subunit 31
MATESSQDVPMGSPPPAPIQADQEPKYGGYSRFEIELEVCLHPALPAQFIHG